MARLGGRWWVWAEKCRIIQGGENLRAHLPAQGMVTLNSDAFSQGVLKTEDGNSTASMGNPFQCLIIRIV